MVDQIIVDLQQLTETGRQFMARGDLSKAREIFSRVLALLPDSRPRARLSYRGRDRQIVISRLEGASCPLSPLESLGIEARLALADCCLDSGLVEESIRHLEEAVEVCPDEAEAYCRLGQAYERDGRSDLALSALRRALRLDPELPGAYHSLAQHYVRQERMEEAIKALRKALQFSPDSHEYHLGLAGCLLQQGRLNKAATLLQQAVRRFPGVPLVHEMLAELYLRSGDCPKAVAEAEELVRLHPRRPYSLDLLAIAHFRAGDLDRAISALGRLVRLDPFDPVPRMKRAILLQQQGELARAMDEYQWVAMFSSDDEMTDVACEAIETLDSCQTQQILMRAAEDEEFRANLEQDVEKTVSSHGYRLTDRALEAIRRLDLDPDTLPDQWKITYH